LVNQMPEGAVLQATIGK